MPVTEEAIGLAEAASEEDLPYIISFTIQRDGCLIDGTTIYEAIRKIDKQVERKLRYLQVRWENYRRVRD